MSSPSSPPSSSGDKAATHLGSLQDVKQLGLVAAISSLSYVFWIVGGMEMVERLAYYGVKTLATLYAKDPVSKGGLGVTMTDFGTVLTCWALTQSLLPVFTGGLSDRFGYKKTIALSTAIKILGYLTMAMLPSYGGFFLGAIILAAGTAVFKPGIQGTLVKSTTRENSSMAWGIFYQTVNIGGFIGPLVAGYFRKLEWRYVFLANAAAISLNFLLLLMYTEPGKKEREAELARRKASGEQKSLWTESLAELMQAHVLLYLAIFSGFWFMFNSIFDIMTAHMEDWVDTREIVQTFFGTGGTDSVFAKFFIVMNKAGTEIQPEGMININGMWIMTLCFAFAWISGKMRAITSMVIGTLFAALSLVLAGATTTGWLCVAGISIFSIGEMLSSPKFSEYIGNFAPDDKKGMYLGFSQIPLAIGWTLEGFVGPRLYDHFASKDRFARELLEQKGLLDHAAAAAIPQGEAFDRAVALLHTEKWALTRELYAAHNPGVLWYFMGAVGVVSAIGIWWYGTWVAKRARAAAQTTV